MNSQYLKLRYELLLVEKMGKNNNSRQIKKALEGRGNLLSQPIHNVHEYNNCD